MKCAVKMKDLGTKRFSLNILYLLEIPKFVRETLRKMLETHRKHLRTIWNMKRNISYEIEIGFQSFLQLSTSDNRKIRNVGLRR